MNRLKPPSKEESQLLPPFVALPDHAVHVPTSAQAFAAARDVLLAQQALGFDTESKPIFQVNQVDTGPHVVQLATPQQAWVLQLQYPEGLALAREIISHPGICKVGFGLDNDKNSLPKRLGVPLANIVDLDAVFKRYGYGASTGVRAAVAMVLGQSFYKSKKHSTSNWSLAQLSAAQIRYAANDAHGPAMVFAALPAWQARQPVPPERPSRKVHGPAAASTEQSAHAPANTAAAPVSPGTTASGARAVVRGPRVAALLRAPQRKAQGQ